MTQTLNKFLIPPAPVINLDWLPSQLHRKLLPFQKEGIYFAISKNGRCLIGDEMGLGKTLQAIAVAYYYKNEWPLLILLPASIKFQWVEELEKWLPELLPTDINMLNSSSDVGNITKCKINIVSYSLLRFGNPNTSLLLKAIRAQHFKVIICDESHNIKNKKTRTANLVVDLVKSAKRCLLLSGTPALNKPSELYTQIDSILPDAFGSFRDYTLRYCDGRFIYFGRSKVWNSDGAKNLDELEYKLKRRLMIRRLKKDVLKQLPPKRRQKVPFDLKFTPETADLQKELAAMQEELERLMASANTSVAEALNRSQGELPVMCEIRRLFSQLYVKTCAAKVGPVVEFVLFYVNGDEGSKVLLFAHHHAMMNSLQKALWDADIKHIRIDGHVPSADRNLLVKQFQNDPKTRVAILSILAAGTGLTLTAANMVVFTELYWTPAILMQCEDRAHRIGQTAKSVNIYYLVARGTIDERVWNMVEKKTRVLALALDGQKKKGLSAVNSNKHVCDILSTADLQEPADVNEAAVEDVNIEDFFTLAQLKCCNQPTLKQFLSPLCQAKTSTARKRPKKLVMRPAEVVDIMNDSDCDDEDAPRNKNPRLSDESFMKWALKDGKSEEGKTNSPVSEHSLPSLSSPAHLSGNEATVDIEKASEELTSEAVELKDDMKTPVVESTMVMEGGSESTVGKEGGSETTVGKEGGSESTVGKEGGSESTVGKEGGSESTVGKVGGSGFTKLQDKKAYSPVEVDVVKKENVGHVETSEPQTELVASFNIVPGLSDAKCANGSDLSGDLFSDASFEDEMFNDVDDQAEQASQPLVDKAEEARLAAELLGSDDSVQAEEEEYWRCQCGQVNDREEECCTKCALAQMPTTWTCKKCQTLNKMADDFCDECLTDKEEATEEEERVVDLSNIRAHEKLYFLVSQHTNRLFIHDEEKKYLECSFHIIDLENPDLLPDLLLHPHNFELAKDFATKWNSLKKREQKSLVKKVELIDCPEKAYFGGKLTKLRKTNKQRYKSKKDVANEAAKLVEENPEAQARHIVNPHRWNQMGEGGYMQVVSANKKPLCINCHKEYESDLLSTSTVCDERNAWQTRFCSRSCADDFLLKSHGGYIRDSAKSLEAGVCQQCELDASAMYKRVRCSRSMKERAELIQGSRYASLSTAVKISMVKEPTEGQFWHVDHILPVYAGGGQCEIDNLRTLCTPCHQVVTSAQAGERARAKAACGNQSLTDFFSPVTKQKLKGYD